MKQREREREREEERKGRKKEISTPNIAVHRLNEEEEKRRKQCASTTITDRVGVLLTRTHGKDFLFFPVSHHRFLFIPFIHLFCRCSSNYKVAHIIW